MSEIGLKRSLMVDRPAHVPLDRVIDLDIFNLPGGRHDFHGAWKALQNAELPEIVWTPHNEGHWLVTTGRLVSQIFEDYERFSSRVVFLPKSEGENHQFPPETMDPPVHRPFRNLLNSGLSPKAVTRKLDAIRELTVSLIEGFRLEGRCNFVAEFAEQLPIRVFMSLVDLPMEDAAKLKFWATQCTHPDGTMPMKEAAEHMMNYLSHYIEQRRGRDGTDFLSTIANGKIGDRPITPEEAAGLCGSVIFGGLDTVVNTLSFILHHLATDPSSRRQLVNHPELIGGAVEELLRRFPIITVGREITSDIVFEGLEMKRGEMIVLPTVLHGLDDRENERSTDVDYERNTIHHSTFGGGTHKCPGAQLARAEIRIVLEEWLRRIPVFSIEPNAEVTFTAGITGCVDLLPLVWDPATTQGAIT